MAWGGGNIRNLRCFRTYDQALHHYNSVLPIRGRTPETRPLGKRRSHNQTRIIKNADESIGLVLYQTEVVRIYPDNTFRIYTGGWDSITTSAFISSTTPVLAAFTHREKTAVRLMSGDYFVPHDGLLLEYDENKRLSISKKQTIDIEYNYFINKSAAAEVRRRYKHFTKYLKNMCKLRTEEGVIKLSQTEAESSGCLVKNGDTHWHINTASCSKIQSRLFHLLNPDEELNDDNIDNWNDAFYTLAFGTAHRHCILMGDCVRVSPTAIQTLWNTCLMREHAEEVLDRRPLPPGQLPHNRYKDWV